MRSHLDSRRAPGENPEPEGSTSAVERLPTCSEKTARLKSTLLKATILVNWSRGPFGSGTHHAKLVEAAQDLMSRKGADNEFMSMMADLEMIRARMHMVRTFSSLDRIRDLRWARPASWD